MAGKKRRKKRIWLWLLLIAAVVVGVFALRGRESAAVYQEIALTQGDISTAYSFTGSVVAPHTQTAVAPATGKVMEVYVEGNQRVRSGDRLLGLAGGVYFDTYSRATQGVKLMRVREDENIIAIAKVLRDDEEPEEASEQISMKTE